MPAKPTMPPAAEALPCPFCGIRPEIEMDIDQSTTWLVCRSPRCIGMVATSAPDLTKAIARWNTRPTTP